MIFFTYKLNVLVPRDGESLTSVSESLSVSERPDRILTGRLLRENQLLSYFFQEEEKFTQEQQQCCDDPSSPPHSHCPHRIQESADAQWGFY
jgi:hypothetical protein